MNAKLTMKEAKNIEPKNYIATGHGLQTWKEVRNVTRFHNEILQRNQIQISVVPGPWIDCESHVRECDDLICVIERVEE